MRTSWLLLGAILGLAGVYAYLTQEQETETAKQPQTKPMNQPGERLDRVQREAQPKQQVEKPQAEKPQAEKQQAEKQQAPKQPVAAGAHPVADMVDEVVHHKDIPETPIKQAFEQALGG